jgi:hypothetical protein
MWRACDAKLQGRHILVAMFAEGGAVCRELRAESGME